MRQVKTTRFWAILASVVLSAWLGARIASAGFGPAQGAATGGGGGGSQTLAQTLALGNSTGGTSVAVTNGDSIIFGGDSNLYRDVSQGALDANFGLAPTTASANGSNLNLFFTSQASISSTNQQVLNFYGTGGASPTCQIVTIGNGAGVKCPYLLIGTAAAQNGGDTSVAQVFCQAAGNTVWACPPTGAELRLSNTAALSLSPANASSATAADTFLWRSAANTVSVGTLGNNALGTIKAANETLTGTLTLTGATISGLSNLSITDTSATNNNVLSVTKNPAGAQSGVGINVLMGATTTGTAIFANQTTGGSGKLLQLQNNAADKFFVDNQGFPTVGSTLTFVDTGATGFTQIIDASTNGIILKAGAGSISLKTGGNTNKWQFTAAQSMVGVATGVYGLSSAADAFGASNDTGWSRTAAATWAAGNGTQGDVTGSVIGATFRGNDTTTGTALTVRGGNGSAGNGGGLALNGGTAATGNSTGGSVTLTPAGSIGSGAAGSITGTAGQSVTGTAGAISWTAGTGGSTSGAGGIATLAGGPVTTTSASANGGAVNVNGGSCTGTTTTGSGGACSGVGGLGGTTSGTGGAWSGTGGAGQGSTSGAGGSATVAGGAGSTASNNNGAGGISLSTGASSGSGTGQILCKVTSIGASGAAANSLLTLLTMDNTQFTIAAAGLLPGAGNTVGGVIQGTAGAGAGSGAGGAVSWTGGAVTTTSSSATAGNVNITGGACSGTTTTGNGGSLVFAGGAGGTSQGNGGPVSFTGGGGAGATAASANGGLCTVAGGAGFSGGNNNNGGGVTANAGNSTGTGTAALLFQVPPASASGATLNTSATVLTINQAGFVYLALQNSSTVGNVSLTAAKGGTASGAGGNFTAVAGAAGTAGGATGTVTITAGANAIASGSTAGGAVSIAGGACSGTTSTGAGGACSEVGGLGGTTSGTGGAWSGTGGAGAGSTSGAGGSSTVAGGAGSTASNNNNGGSAVVSTGLPSGTGTANIQMQTGFTNASGATAQTAGDRFYVAGHNITMSNTTATPTTVAILNVPTSNSSGGCMIIYEVSANDGTNWNTATGSFTVSCSNKAGTVTATTAAITDESSNVNSGTLSAGAVTTTVASQAVSIKIAPTFTVIVPTTVITSVTIIPFGKGVTVSAQ